MELRVTVQGKHFEGPVVESHISKDAALIKADLPDRLPFMPIGSMIETRLTHNSSAEESPARIVCLERSAEGLQCTVVYSLDVLPRIRALIYGRRAVRVRPSLTMPLRVKLPERVSVEVYDISTGGIALLVSDELQHLITRWELSLRLFLPGDESEIHLEGNVKQRRLVGSSVLYGIEFDPVRTPRLEAKQELIHQYVMDRQSEALRDRASRSPS